MGAGIWANVYTGASNADLGAADIPTAAQLGLELPLAPTAGGAWWFRSARTVLVGRMLTSWAVDSKDLDTRR